MINLWWLVYLMSHAPQPGAMWESFDGRCPVCVAHGERSKVYGGSCMRTLVALSSYYDEDGQYHFDEPNTTTCYYTCSRQHRLTIDRIRDREIVTYIGDEEAPDKGDHK